MATATVGHRGQLRGNLGLPAPEYEFVGDRLMGKYIINRTQGTLGISLDAEYCVNE